MEKQQGKAPQIRFPEFKELWEHKKLSQVFIEVTEKIGLRNIETYSITAGYGFVSQKVKFGKDISGKQNQNYILLKPGQFAYNKGASKTFKYGCVYYNNLEKEIAVPNVFISFKLIDDGMANYYFQKLFEKHYLDKELKKLIASTARIDGLLNISKHSFFNIKIPVPSLPEQTRIASFFTAIDQKLAQLKQKKTLLGQYKKGVMQKLFSQELRFKDENGKEFPEWEKKKLGEIATFSKGKGISKSDISDEGSIECIRYGELYTHYKEVITEIVSKTDINEYELVLSEKNDVIIPASGETQIDIAKASCVTKSGVALSGDLNIIKSANNGIFLSYYLNNAKKQDIANLAQGVSVVHLYSSQLALLSLEIPCFTEQTKIVNFLSAIDEKINRTENQIQQTQEWKKGLLQRMFC